MSLVCNASKCVQFKILEEASYGHFTIDYQD